MGGNPENEFLAGPNNAAKTLYGLSWGWKRQFYSSSIVDGNKFRKLPLRSYFLIKRNQILNFITSLQQYKLFTLFAISRCFSIHGVLRNRRRKPREDHLSRGNKSKMLNNISLESCFVIREILSSSTNRASQFHMYCCTIPLCLE